MQISKLFHWKTTPSQAFNEFLYEFLRIYLISENSLKFANFFCWGNEFSIWVKQTLPIFIFCQPTCRPCVMGGSIHCRSTITGRVARPLVYFHRVFSYCSSYCAEGNVRQILSLHVYKLLLIAVIAGNKRDRAHNAQNRLHSRSTTFFDNVIQGDKTTALRNKIMLKAPPGEWICVVSSPRAC